MKVDRQGGAKNRRIMGPARQRVQVVGIAGPSGAGKTTFARAAQAALAPLPSVLIAHDDYYRDLGHLALEERARANFDHPDALETELLVAQLQALKRGEVVRKPRYDFALHARRAETEALEPAPVLIVEGILVLADERLRAQLDLAVYVDTPLDICLARRVLRDVGERGRTADSVIAQYLHTVRPMLLRYVLPSRAFADTVVHSDGLEAQAVEVARRLTESAQSA